MAKAPPTPNFDQFAENTSNGAGVRTNEVPRHRSMRSYKIYSTELLQFIGFPIGAGIFMSVGWHYADKGWFDEKAAGSPIDHSARLSTAFAFAAVLVCVALFGLTTRKILHESGDRLRDLLWDRAPKPEPEKKPRAGKNARGPSSSSASPPPAPVAPPPPSPPQA